MQKTIGSLMIALPFALACGGSFPPPTQRMADAQSAERSARELGANSDPSAEMSLKLAQDQIAAAKKAMAQDDNERANALLIRAQADAELSIAQAREKAARSSYKGAVDDAEAQKETNEGQGAVK